MDVHLLNLYRHVFERNCQCYDVPYDDFSVEVTSGDLSSGSYSFDGYQTLEELKKNYVDEVADEFDCEWDVSDSMSEIEKKNVDFLNSYR